jgi:hypothetical protein
MEDWEDLGAISLSVQPADRIVVGILEDSPDNVAVALGFGQGEFILLECAPSKARQIAASLLNKSDSIDERKAAR